MPARDFDPADDLALLEEAVREAGHIARRFYGGEFKRWDKGAAGPVTEADLAIDTFLKDRLRSARPGYGWLSEETEDDPARRSFTSIFVVDPIDGTLAFVRNKPQFTICAGIASDGRPVAGVVYNPITDECFRARRGDGAFCNGERIHVHDRDTVDGCRMLGDKPMFQHEAWKRSPNIPWPEMHIETRSSIAYRMVLVARGDFDAMLALSSKRDWDIGAAEVIVTEAGGVVTAHTGETFRYNGPTAVQPSIVAAGPKLHAKLLERVSHLKLPERRA